MFFKTKSSVDKLLTEENRKKILDAVKTAEGKTSGEIRVHIEAKVKENKSPLDRSIEIFEKLGMRNTEARNGILIYAALDDRKFAIFGDEGINDKVGDEFWEREKEEMTTWFKRGEIISGITYFIERIGEKLETFFPCQDNDANELSDEISTGN